VESCGLLKMDLLGLRTLSVIDDSLENIRLTHGQNIDISAIPLDDPRTYQMLGEGDAVAVFQLESEGMRKILKNLKPERLEDIIALVAMYRPGPLGSGMDKDFISNKHGETEVHYMHPLLEDILKETYGVILYQEQVMQITTRLAGFSLGQADLMRRAMGKKKPDIIAKERGHFVEGCQQNNIDGKLAGEIFDLLEYFAGYGFNKSHSAAYGLVSYQTAWLKANYPEEFMAAMMTTVMDTADKIPEYIEECKRMGIEVLPPDINESYTKFAVVDKKIRFAMAAVKNVGRDAVEKIVEEREANGPYSSMADLCRRLPLNRKMLENLIKCGAFDSLGAPRSQLLEAMDRALEMGRKLNGDQESGQPTLFDFGMERTAAAAPELQLKNIPEYPSAELLAMEKETIGFYISGHPMDSYSRYFGKKVSGDSSSLVDMEDAQPVTIGGQITDLRIRPTKSGTLMASFFLADKAGMVRCVVFPRNYASLKSWFMEGRVLLLGGKVKVDEGRREIIVDSCAVPMKLFLRLPSSEDGILLNKVNAILQRFPGDGEVKYYFNDIKQYESSGIAGITPDIKLFVELEELLGKENVVAK